MVNMTDKNGNGSNGNGVIANGDAQVSYRGTIIVDASSLFELSEQIPQRDPIANSRDIETSSYLDFLPFLARNGYRIVIPEMILIEAGKILKSGHNADSFSNRSLKFKSVDDLKQVSDKRQLLTRMLKDSVLPEGDEIRNIPIL